MGTGPLIASSVIPVALLGPQSIEAGELVLAPAVLLLGNLGTNFAGALAGPGLLNLFHHQRNHQHIPGHNGGAFIHL